MSARTRHDSPRRARRRVRALVVLGLAVALAPQAPPAAGKFFVVNTTVDAGDFNPGDGLCRYVNLNVPACALRAAIQEANAYAGTDIIVVPAGTYTLSLTGEDDLAAVGDLDISSSLGILGAGADLVTIDGNLTDRIFDIVSAVQVTILHVTLTRGVATSGGAIAVRSGELSLGYCRLVGNRGGVGGGLANNAITHVEDCDITDNAANGDGQLIGIGGGIFSTFGGAALTVTASSIRDNVALDGGGGVAIAQSSFTLDASTVTGNDPDGILVSGGLATVISSTVVGNVDMGIRAFGSQPAVACTIVAQHPGGNCDPAGLLPQSSSNLLDDTSCGSTVGLVVGDAGLGNLVRGPNGTWGRPPLAGSPAIDLSPNGQCSTPDQWGAVRPSDGDGDGIADDDVGAIEGVMLFADGFESAATGAWSAAQP